MTTKSNPFLAGMRATGKSEWEKPEDRKEYEAGFMAINDLIRSIERMDSMIHLGPEYQAKAMASDMRDIDAAWSRIKAAIEGEVKP